MKDDRFEKLGLGIPNYHGSRPGNEYDLDSVYRPDGALEPLTDVLEGFLTPWSQSGTADSDRTTRHFKETYTVKDEGGWDVIPDSVSLVINSTEFRRGIDKVIYDVVLKRMVASRWTTGHTLATKFTIEQSTDEWTPYFGYIVRPDTIRPTIRYTKPDIMTPYDCGDMLDTLTSLLKLQNEQAYKD